jgi:hypothetical protein
LRGDHELEILARLDSALSACYGVWELLKVNGRDQAAWAGADAERQNIVGLVFARGEATHQGTPAAVPDARASIFGAALLPGLVGRAWVWAELGTHDSRYAASKHLYDRHLLERPVLSPLERALRWFEAEESLSPRFFNLGRTYAMGPFHNPDPFALSPRRPAVGGSEHVD